MYFQADTLTNVIYNSRTLSAASPGVSTASFLQLYMTSPFCIRSSEVGPWDGGFFHQHPQPETGIPLYRTSTPNTERPPTHTYGLFITLTILL